THHLRARRVLRDVAREEVELELSLTFGEQRSQHAAQRRAALELPCDLFDREQIGEGVLAPIARRGRVPHESPLLEVAQMFVGDRRVEAADIAEAVRAAG